MPTDTQHDLHEFHTWLGTQLSNGGGRMTLEESIAEFRAYQEELDRCRAEIRVSLDELERGELEPLDMGDVIRRVTTRLQARGISD
jgi:hypothetical protein